MFPGAKIAISGTFRAVQPPSQVNWGRPQLPEVSTQPAGQAKWPHEQSQEARRPGTHHIDRFLHDGLHVTVLTEASSEIPRLMGQSGNKKQNGNIDPENGDNSEALRAPSY